MELSAEIRNIATKKYVRPALRAGKTEFSIAVRDLMADARAEGISTVQRTPPFCTSIQTREFLEDNGLEVVRVDGPEKKLSTTVVVHYRSRVIGGAASPTETVVVETPEERAKRLGNKLLGLMKEEIAAYGGGKAYLRWVRGDDKDAA
jgi:hypothetical protein